MEDVTRALDEAVGKGCCFDVLDSVLIESASQLVQPTGRAIVRVTVDGEQFDGDLVWMDASFLKVRRADGGEAVIVPKNQLSQLQARPRNLPNQRGFPRASSMDTPEGLFVNGTTLYVCDSQNHRVLGFHHIPPGNGFNADFLLGQSDFGLDTAGTSTNKLDTPLAVASDGNRLLVADSGNHRVLVFNSAVAVNNPTADSVLGQGNFTVGSPNRSSDTPTAESLFSPTGAFFNGVAIWVTDQENSRVVRFR